ncbi:UbiA family prenyltransferase [Jiangella sp. DSM 45060]|uniref:UbiA family prenyltransferase n=1 Tax=Jiangella sp. DSM 45060 TaxID=1798224 RepID=UPI00087C9872|nr:UbiA family prenyltransferase [Jiangella sp. DSM 45060]SDS11970.1 chlorophyll synthase [Jiangella sp. DSM 45060]
MTTVRTRSGPARPRQLAGDVLAIGRPWFWFVSLLPYYLGVVLATERLVPPVEDWPVLALGAVVIGPLVWISVLAVNDAHDLRGDRLNPRKAGSPLVGGRLTPAAAQLIALVAGLLAVAAALFAGPLFALGTAVVLLVGWAYSAPPLRLKARPGFDVAVNALAIGAAGQLAGWSLLRPLTEFPWPMAVLGTLVGAALYVPTTLADLEADRTSGYTTLAVRLGPRRAYLLGLGLWLAAGLLSLAMSAADMVIPRSMLPMEIVLVPLLVLAYRRLVRAERTFRGIIAVAVLFLVPSLTFVLTFTGTLP